MQGKTNKNLNRVLAGIMAIMMLSAVLCSFFFLAKEVGHQCHEENCPICESIELCTGIVRRLSAGVTFAVVLAALTVFSFSVFSATEHIFCEDTLVSRKIRLND